MVVISDNLRVKQVSVPCSHAFSPNTAVLHPQTAPGGRDGSLSKLHLSGFVFAQSKEHPGATRGTLVRVTFEPALRSFVLVKKDEPFPPRRIKQRTGD